VGLGIGHFSLQLEQKHHQHGRCEQIQLKQEACQLGRSSEKQAPFP
jgi:hypothetical protein